MRKQQQVETTKKILKRGIQGDEGKGRFTVARPERSVGSQSWGPGEESRLHHRGQKVGVVMRSRAGLGTFPNLVGHYLGEGEAAASPVRGESVRGG